MCSAGQPTGPEAAILARASRSRSRGSCQRPASSRMRTPVLPRIRGQRSGSQLVRKHLVYSSGGPRAARSTDAPTLEVRRMTTPLATSAGLAELAPSRSDRRFLDLHLSAAASALDDAGIGAEDVDGLLCCPAPRVLSQRHRLGHGPGYRCRPLCRDGCRASRLRLPVGQCRVRPGLRGRRPGVRRPAPAAIESMGSKSTAKAMMAAGVPVLPSSRPPSAASVRGTSW